MTARDAEQVIARELEPGERLLWSGVPKQGLLLRGSDAFVIPFSLLWGGFAIFWEGSVLQSGAPFFFALWGIPFVLVGLYLIVGRFFVDASQRAGTAYGFTDKRVVISSGVFSRTVKSLSLRTVSDMTVTERRDRSGTIALGPTPPWGQWYAGAAWPGLAAQRGPAFELIEDAKSVYTQLLSAQSAAQRVAG